MHLQMHIFKNIFLVLKILAPDYYISYYTFRKYFTAYFEVGNYNVICVDWKQYSTDISYAVAKKRSKYIALDIVKVLLKITYNMTMGCYDTLHVIGHSMGAHIAGHVGKNLPGVDRITGNLQHDSCCAFKIIFMLLKNEFTGSIDQFILFIFFPFATNHVDRR